MDSLSQAVSASAVGSFLKCMLVPCSIKSMQCALKCPPAYNVPSKGLRGARQCPSHSFRM
eukprot:143459-Pelagomonas_calceolata.AAC.1